MENKNVSREALDKILVDAIGAANANDVRDHVLEDEETIIVGEKLDFKVHLAAVEMKSRLLGYINEQIAALDAASGDPGGITKAEYDLQQAEDMHRRFREAVAGERKHLKSGKWQSGSGTIDSIKGVIRRLTTALDAAPAQKDAVEHVHQLDDLITIQVEPGCTSTSKGRDWLAAMQAYTTIPSTYSKRDGGVVTNQPSPPSGYVATEDVKHSINALCGNHCTETGCKAKTKADCDKCAIGMHLKDLNALVDEAGDPVPIAGIDPAKVEKVMDELGKVPLTSTNILDANKQKWATVDALAALIEAAKKQVPAEPFTPAQIDRTEPDVLTPWTDAEGLMEGPVVHDPLACNDCGCKIIFDYAATNRSWNKTVGTEDNPRGEGIMLCINCFCKRAIAKGEYPYFEMLFVVRSRFKWKKEWLENSQAKVERQRENINELVKKYKGAKGTIKALNHQMLVFTERLGLKPQVPMVPAPDYPNNQGDGCAICGMPGKIGRAIYLCKRCADKPMVPAGVVEDGILHDFDVSERASQKHYGTVGMWPSAKQIVKEYFAPHRPAPKGNEPKCKTCRDKKRVPSKGKLHPDDPLNVLKDIPLIPCPDCAEATEPNIERHAPPELHSVFKHLNKAATPRHCAARSTPTIEQRAAQIIKQSAPFIRFMMTRHSQGTRPYTVTCKHY